MSATLYATAASKEEARTLAKAAVESKLAACANLFTIDSVYRWEGKVSEEPEVAILFKTRGELTDRLMDLISKMHSYDCPCMVVLPWDGAHPPYAQWVVEETKRAEEQTSADQRAI